MKLDDLGLKFSSAPARPRPPEGRNSAIVGQRREAAQLAFRGDLRMPTINNDAERKTLRRRYLKSLKAGDFIICSPPQPLTPAERLAESFGRRRPKRPRTGAGF